jgi:cold shock protein
VHHAAGEALRASRRCAATAHGRPAAFPFSIKHRGRHVSVTGKVKFFNETKGYGFFTRDDGSGDVFMHRTDLPPNSGSLYEDQPVTFEIDRTHRGLRAVNIALV